MTYIQVTEKADNIQVSFEELRETFNDLAAYLNKPEVIEKKEWHSKTMVGKVMLSQLHLLAVRCNSMQKEIFDLMSALD